MFEIEVDASAWQQLEEIYRRLSERGEADYRDTWRLFAANERFQRELRRAAGRLAKTRGIPNDRVPDIVHEALLVLADRLRSRGCLPAMRGRGTMRAVGWSP